MMHGYRSAYQTSSPSRSRTPRTPASPARKAAGRGGGAVDSAGSSEASTPTGRELTRPRSTTQPSTASSSGNNARPADQTAVTAMLPPLQPRRAEERATDGLGATEAIDSAATAPAHDSFQSSTDLTPSTHPLRVSTAPLTASTPFAKPLSSVADTAGPLSDRLLAVDEQPSSARSDSAALWQSTGRAVSGSDKLPTTAPANERRVSLSQPVSPAKVRGRSLLLQTLPAQLFSPTRPPASTQPSSVTEPGGATAAAAAHLSSNSHSARSSAAASSSGSATPSPTAMLRSPTSTAPPALASYAPPASAAAATLSPEKLNNFSPGLAHLLTISNRRKEVANEQRRRLEEELAEQQQQQQHEVGLLTGEQPRTALTMEELQPRLVALQAERKEADEQQTAATQQRSQHTETTEGADQGELPDTRCNDGEALLSASTAAAGTAAVVADNRQRREDEAAKASADDGYTLPVLVGGLLLVGASAYASWLWYRSQRRRLGVRR